MSAANHWQPPVPRAEVMKLIDEWCEEFRAVLNDTESPAIEDPVTKIQRYLVEMARLHPGVMEARE